MGRSPKGDSAAARRRHKVKWSICLLFFNGREIGVWLRREGRLWMCRRGNHVQPRINKGCDLHTSSQKSLPLSLVGRLRPKCQDRDVSEWRWHKCCLCGTLQPCAWRIREGSPRRAWQRGVRSGRKARRQKYYLNYCYSILLCRALFSPLEALPSLTFMISTLLITGH